MPASKLARRFMKLTLNAFLLLGLSGCGFSVKATLLGSSSHKSTLTYMRGINIMDLGIANTVLPGVYGTNYTKPTLSSLQSLKARGHNVVRIPFLWERLQPILGGSLDSTYLGYLIDVLKDANTAGLKVILDMHNFAQYTSGGIKNSFGSDSGPTSAQYADVWTKISTAIQAEPLAAAAVYSYDIMNEPANIYDSRNAVPTVGSFSVASFAATDEGWIPRDNSDTVVAQDTRNGGSLKVTMNASSGTRIFGARLDNSVQQTSLTNGPTFRVRGYMPTTTPGTNARVRFGYYDTGFSYYTSPTTSITKGESFELQYSPPSGSFSGNLLIMIEFIVDSSDGSAPLVAYIDDIVQGTAATGISPQKVWENYSQAAVDAIRANNDKTLISVQGYNFSSAKDWATNHPTKWISDSADNHMYDAHVYFDDDSSGSYANNFATETTNAQGQGYASVAARSVARVKVFTDWITAQNVKGFIGEYGWPNSAVAGTSDADSWNTVGDAFLTHLDSVEMGATMWATGSWLSPTDNALNAYVLGASFQALSQTTVLESHLSR